MQLKYFYFVRYFTNILRHESSQAAAGLPAILHTDRAREVTSERRLQDVRCEIHILLFFHSPDEKCNSGSFTYSIFQFE